MSGTANRLSQSPFCQLALRPPRLGLGHLLMARSRAWIPGSRFTQQQQGSTAQTTSRSREDDQSWPAASDTQSASQDDTQWFGSAGADQWSRWGSWWSENDGNRWNDSGWQEPPPPGGASTNEAELSSEEKKQYEARLRQLENEHLELRDQLAELKSRKRLMSSA